MACYHPNIAMDKFWIDLQGEIQYEYTESGKRAQVFLGSAENYHSRHEKSLMMEYMQEGLARYVPCKKCIGCRYDYARNWADRMCLELDHSKKAFFLTLTYDDAHAHVCSMEYDDTKNQYTYNLSLCERDITLFWKRLRERFPDKKIRYFVSGEYGTTTDRPHYHAIVFGMDLNDFPDKFIAKYKRREHGVVDVVYGSDYLKEIWTHGNVGLAEANYKTMAYTARYTAKKVEGSDAKCDYKKQVREFNRMSNRPGIGMYYLQEHPECHESKIILNGGVQINLPQKLYEKLEEINPIAYNQLRQQREKLALDKNLQMLQNTDLDYIRYLHVQEEKMINKTKCFKRDEF